MDYRNSTTIDDAWLYPAVLRYTWPYRHQDLRVRFRPSRGADFSGACYYKSGRIFVNIGRHNRYPYTFATQTATRRGVGGAAVRFSLVVADAGELALFVYLHELFHWLVYAAGLPPRRREAVCDRFATRVMVDHFGCALLGADGAQAGRAAWDVDDLAALVANAPRQSGPVPQGPSRGLVHPEWAVAATGVSHLASGPVGSTIR